MEAHSYDKRHHNIGCCCYIGHCVDHTKVAAPGWASVGARDWVLVGAQDSVWAVEQGWALVEGPDSGLAVAQGSVWVGQPAVL